jgi:hypothetical protein
LVVPPPGGAPGPEAAHAATHPKVGVGAGGSVGVGVGSSGGSDGVGRVGQTVTPATPVQGSGGRLTHTRPRRPTVHLLAATGEATETVR